MILIYTALYPEAKPIIEYLNLKQYETKPFKIYKSENILLIVGGMGKDKTTFALNEIYNNYKIQKAINIGICGCRDENIEIGTFFDISNKENFLTTVDKPLDEKEKLNTPLVDMEAKYFKEISKKYINEESIYIYKVVSDHLNKAIPKKSFVNMLIKNTLDKWSDTVGV